MIHLFTATDSFLNYVSSKNPEFNLSRLLKFNGDDLVLLPSPVGWIKMMGGASGEEFPDRRAEALKSHSRLRRYIVFKLHDGIDFIPRKGDIRTHLQDIDQQVEDLKLFKTLSRLSNIQKNRKKAMQKILEEEEKNDDEDEFYGCQKWFKSKECSQLEIEAFEIWSKSMELNSVTKKGFDRFSKICMFELGLCDKSRPGVYQKIRNLDYVSKKKVYLPPGVDTDGNYENLQDGWQIYKKPGEDVKPSAFEIRLFGDEGGLKGLQQTTITVNLRVHELLEKMR